LEYAAYQVSKLVQFQSESQFICMLVMIVNVELVGLPGLISLDFFDYRKVPLTILLLKYTRKTVICKPTLDHYCHIIV
jgi:hypothetical protein